MIEKPKRDIRRAWSNTLAQSHLKKAQEHAQKLKDGASRSPR